MYIIIYITAMYKLIGIKREKYLKIVLTNQDLYCKIKSQNRRKQLTKAERANIK